MAYKLNRTGDNVSDLLTQVADKSIYPDATQEAHGLLSAADKAKLDALPDVVYGTTSYWNSQITYVPPQGKVVVYADYNSKIVDGHTVYIPSIKIGTGLAFLHELPFVGDVSIYGLGAAAYKDVVSTVTSVSTDLPTSSAVHSAIGDAKSELEQEITSVDGDVSELSTKLTNAEGDITDLQVDARGIHTDIRSINEDVAHLDLRADALELDMSNAKGDINQLEVTAAGLRQDVSNAQGDIHTLESTASSLESDISAVDGRVSTLSQTVDGISATVRGQGQDIAGLAIEAHRIDLYAQSVNESLGDYETYANGIMGGLQKQIDGVVDTYFYDYMPVHEDATGAPDSQVPLIEITIEGVTVPCEPYASWYNTDHGGTAQEVNTERIKHLGDVFYDNKSGYAFRFANTGTEQNPVFAWVEIQDSAVIKALADAARAQDTADHKRRVFVYSQDYPTPYAPYDVGDLWVKDIEVYVPPRGSSIVGTTINTRMLYKCRTARARTSNVFPYNPDVNVNTSSDTCDWEPANDNPLEIANANLQLLSDAIVGKVGAYTYDSNGVLTVTSQSLIQQQAHSIILEVTGDELETVGIYINNVSAADNSIVLKADKVYIKGAGNHDATALSVMYDSTTDRYKINTDSLNVDGIFSTSPGSVWATQLTNIKGYADDAANNAYNNAVSQAATNAAEYITLNVVPQITAAQNTADSAQAGVTGMQYLANALGNGTTAIGGGLILTSLVGLGGNSGTGGAWELWSGINGQYSSSDPGHGVGAWYGGSGDSNGNYIDCITIPNWATMTTSERLAAWDTYRYGRSLFRLDGSGYLASGAITWGASGDLHLMDNIYIGAGTSNPFGEYLTFLTKLATWFEDVEETIGGVSRRMLRINMNGTAAGGTDFAGLEFNGFLLTGGDQIVGSGTPGGGGGGGASYLHELLDVEYGLNPSPDDLLIYSNSVSLNPDGTTTGPGWTTIAKSSVGKIYTGGTGISIDNNDAINLATSGVTAGTYRSVTVDAYGRVTSGSNPTTVDSVSLAQGATNGTLHLTVNGTTQTDIAVPGWSSKADASALNDYVTLATAQTVSGAKQFSGGVGIGTAVDSSYALSISGASRIPTIRAGEYIDEYAPVSVTRYADANDYCCYSFIRAGQAAFGMGYSASQEIVLGTPSGNGNGWTGKWLTISSTAITAASFVKSSNSGGFLKANGTEDTTTYIPTSSEGSLVVDSAYNLRVQSGYSSTGATMRYFQQVGFDGDVQEWAHYLTFNHGNWDNYYHFTIAFPFGDKAPKYTRLVSGNARNWYDFLTDENYTTKLDTRYLQLAGGTLTGDLTINKSGSKNIMFSDGSTFHGAISYSPSWGIVVQSSSSDFVTVTSGANGLGYYYSGANHKIWHEGNDGSGSGLDADTLDGAQASSFLIQHGAYGMDVSNVMSWINGTTDPDKLGGMTSWVGTFISFGNTAHGHKGQMLLSKGEAYFRECYGDSDNANWDRIWNSNNANKSTADWSAYDLRAYHNLQVDEVATIRSISLDRWIGFRSYGTTTTNMEIGNLWTVNDQYIRIYGSSTKLHIGHSSNGDAMTINASGEVGFNTDSQSGYPVTIGGNMRITGKIYAGEYVDGYGTICVTRYNDTSNNGYSCYGFTRAGMVGLGLGYNTSNQIVLGMPNSNGNGWSSQWIQIGSGGTTISGTITSSGDQVISSDITKKTNFVPINLSVEQIANAPAVTFDWKDGHGHSFGSIAQYWKPLVPEAVLGKEGDYTLAYGQLGVVLGINNGKAIYKIEQHETEQDKEIRELREALGMANEKIEGLEKEVERLRMN